MKIFTYKEWKNFGETNGETVLGSFFFTGQQKWPLACYFSYPIINFI